MEWYYVENGERKGPVDDAAFQQAVQSGVVTPATLVWNEGMENWQPYGDVASSQPGEQAVAAAAGDQQQCVHCQQYFPSGELIAIGGAPTCADCKPLAVQRLQEGVNMPGEMDYGGFWIRFGAKFLDGIILQLFGLVLQAFFFGVRLVLQEAMDPEILEVIIAISSTGLGFFINCAYYVFFVGKFAATPGKMACGLKIVTADGGRVTYMRAFARFWAELLSGCFTLCIGYIIAAFDDEKRTLHDHICSTRVIRK